MGTTLISEYQSANAQSLGIGQGQGSIAHVQAKGAQPHMAMPNKDLFTSNLQDHRSHLVMVIIRWLLTHLFVAENVISERVKPLWI